MGLLPQASLRCLTPFVITNPEPSLAELGWWLYGDCTLWAGLELVG